MIPLFSFLTHKKAALNPPSNHFNMLFLSLQLGEIKVGKNIIRTLEKVCHHH